MGGKEKEGYSRGKERRRENSERQKEGMNSGEVACWGYERRECWMKGVCVFVCTGLTMLSLQQYHSFKGAVAVGNYG